MGLEGNARAERLGFALLNKPVALACLFASGAALTVTRFRCLFSKVTPITSKQLHEQTGALLDKVKQGQRFRVLRGGETDAFLVPATDQVDPSWEEIMVEVRKARSQGKPPLPNPILRERTKRKYAARVRR